MTFEDQLTPDRDAAKKQKRAAQSRLNGAKSKGPITPQGKSKSSQNAVRHGLTANEHTLLEIEFADEYEELHQAFIADLRPATKAELRLVEKIANLDWRLERLVMMETCVLNMEIDVNAEKIMETFSSIDGIGCIVEAWKESLTGSHCLDLLRRYMATLQHQFNTTLSNFYKFEDRRLARSRGGINLDEAWAPPYQQPRFESHLPSQVEAVKPPLQNEPGKTPSSTALDLPIAPAPVESHPRPQRNEPNSPIEIDKASRPSAKRPAA